MNEDKEAGLGLGLAGMAYTRPREKDRKRVSFTLMDEKTEDRMKMKRRGWKALNIGLAGRVTV